MLLTPGTLSRQLLSNRQPARCSCSPGPWLGLPATKTIFLSAASTADVTVKKPNRVKNSSFIFYLPLLARLASHCLERSAGFRRRIASHLLRLATRSGFIRSRERFNRESDASFEGF